MSRVRTARAALVVVLALLAAACATSRPQPSASGGAYKIGEPYQVNGRWYHPREQPDYDETGLASWYGGEHQGRPTANGEVFDERLPTAAHTTLPLPSLVEVTNLDNGRSATLRVNDRGPFKDGRIIDLSRRAAEELGVLGPGTARVRVRYVGRAPLDGAAPFDVRHAGAPAGGDAGPWPPPPPQSARGWTVQAGSFSSEGNARDAADRLAGVGPAEIVPVAIAGRTFYRVVLGPLPDADLAERARAGAAEAGFPDAMVRSPR